MMGWLGAATVFLATAPTDLRKAFDGLAALVRQDLGQDPLSGSLYVFCNRRRDRIKILIWEPGGYWLCIRRLEAGTFRWPKANAPCALVQPGGVDAAAGRDRSGPNSKAKMVSARERR